MPTDRRINKGLFAAGMQCAKRLYLEFHRPGEIPKPSANSQMLLDVGERLLELACQGFPKSLTIDNEDIGAAAKDTEEVLASSEGTALFGAAFVTDQAEVRCDIVLPMGEGQIDIFEVKSGTRIKPRHIMDCAYQMAVVEGSGHKVRHVSILHLNPEYLHEGGSDLPAHQLFKNVDVTSKVRKRADKAAEFVTDYLAMVADETTQDLPMGTWCTMPIPCQFLESCCDEATDYPLHELPNLTKSLENELHQEGIEDLQQLDEKRPGLTLTQRRALRSVAEQKLLVEPAVHKRLSDVDHPLALVYIDYGLQVIPKFANTRPWQHLPFMWSALVVDESGGETHRHWVADGKADPREEFVKSLGKCAEDCGTLVLYSHRLDSILKQMLEDLPDLKARIRTLQQQPTLELDKLIRTGVYHPLLRGSFDLESVIRALAPEVKFDELDIPRPDDAAAAFARLLQSRTRATTRQKLTTQLVEHGELRCAGLWQVYQQLRG